MKSHLYIFLIFSLILASCNSNNEEDLDSFEALECPPFYNYGIDVDEDGTIDFSIFCSKTILVAFNNTYGHMSVAIESTQNNYHLGKTYSGIFFLEPGDVINTEIGSDSDLFWRNEGTALFSKEYYSDTGWGDTWFTSSGTTIYYMGYKLGNGNVEKLGWIQFEFDLQTGELFIIDKNHTSANSIIIGQ